MVEYLNGNEVFTEKPHSTQVYLVTHDGEGGRLPFMHRSFISFIYGGKHIEDFNLIAVTDGDRMNRSLTAGFEDLTSTYEVVDGQFYWGTHFTTNSLSLSLFTDGITQNLLDEFISWFRAGETKELILAEHPNRAIMARVAAPPQMAMLPFEEHTTVKIAGEDYETSTTLYKGNINLDFVMDDPFWYSKANVLGKVFTKNGKSFIDPVWTDDNNKELNIYETKDVLKIIKEDGVPIGDMFKDKNLLLGENRVVNLDFSIVGNNTGKQTSGGSIKVNDIAVAGASSLDESDRLIVGFVGTSVADISESSGISLPANTKGYLYYFGNAPSYPEIRFTLTPQFDSNGYIISPRNEKSSGTPYNTITFESTNKHEFCFSIPGIYAAYNKVIDIIRDYPSLAKEQYRELIRDEVKHPIVREKANSLLNSGSLTMSGMRTLFSGQSASFVFNSKTGRATAKINYTGGTWEEDAGDMVRSGYLILNERNYPNEQGFIIPWTEANPTTGYCFYSDVSGGLTNFFITYKNMFY